MFWLLVKSVFYVAVLLLSHSYFPPTSPIYTPPLHVLPEFSLKPMRKIEMPLERILTIGLFLHAIL